MIALHVGSPCADWARGRGGPAPGRCPDRSVVVDMDDGMRELTFGELPSRASQARRRGAVRPPRAYLAGAGTCVRYVACGGAAGPARLPRPRRPGCVRLAIM